ncbi:MAG: hypothetical protein A2Z08_10325 [Deltaproteobacteria bacterium RBG_16_54_11]|jgi:hypothetical protein|nr:MAG: hypothetical protein A2Z08_10325 [Deltaproteobacteria bacterium RBG_16_54_11]
MGTMTIRYYFTLPEGVREVFNLQFDAKKLELTGNMPDVMPSWTRLDFHQCPNCPLTPDTHPHCPLAAHLVNIVERFEGLISYSEIQVDIMTAERFITQETTVQRGMSSLMGLLMATSGCPHMAFFKPMARFHLPFASAEETVYRATSMYLLAQYFLHKEGHQADLDLTGLREIYNNIEIVNVAVAKRLRTATEADSAINAIILLDIYTKAIPVVIEESLEEIRYLFAPFFKEAEKRPSKKPTE